MAGPDPFEQQNAAFIDWLVNARGAEINPKVALTDLRAKGSGRGVVAVSPLSKDELVFRLPRTGALSIQTSELFRLLPAEEAEELASKLDPWLALILVLIFETRPQSPWKPYIDLLPHEFDSLIFWSPQELSALRGSSVLDKIGREEADEAFLQKLLPVIKRNESVFRETGLVASAASSRIDDASFEGHVLREAHRMASVIMSYSFDLVVPEKKATVVVAATSSQDVGESGDDLEEEDEEVYKAMVPLADMLNADADRNNCRLFESPAGLEMKTICAVGSGSELFNDYGPLPRSDLLRRYGYITPNYAQYDVVEIGSPLIIDKASPSLEDADRMVRVDYLLDQDVLDDSFDLDTSCSVPDEVIILVRTLLLSPDEFKRHRDAAKLPKPVLGEAVARVLAEVLDARLKDYPTTLEHDKSLLAEDGRVQGRERAAVAVRLGEKQILAGALQNLRRQIEGKRPTGLSREFSPQAGKKKRAKAS